MDSLKERFLEDGYVILKDFLDKDVLESAREELAYLVDNLAKDLLQQGHIQDTFASEPFETRLCKLFQDRLSAAPKIFRSELHRKGGSASFRTEPVTLIHVCAWMLVSVDAML